MLCSRILHAPPSDEAWLPLLGAVASPLHCTYTMAGFTLAPARMDAAAQRLMSSCRQYTASIGIALAHGLGLDVILVPVVVDVAA